MHEVLLRLPDWLHGAKMKARVQGQPVKAIEMQLQPAKTCKHEKSREGPNISLAVVSQVRGLCAVVGRFSQQSHVT